MIYSLSQFTSAHRLNLQSCSNAAGCFLEEGRNNPFITAHKCANLEIMLESVPFLFTVLFSKFARKLLFQLSLKVCASNKIIKIMNLTSLKRLSGAPKRTASECEDRPYNP